MDQWNWYGIENNLSSMFLLSESTGDSEEVIKSDHEAAAMDEDEDHVLFRLNHPEDDVDDDAQSCSYDHSSAAYSTINSRSSCDNSSWHHQSQRLIYDDDEEDDDDDDGEVVDDEKRNMNKQVMDLSNKQQWRCHNNHDEKEINDDDDDDRNHKHRRRDFVRSQSQQREAVAQSFTKPYKGGNKPPENGHNYRESASQSTESWRNYSSHPMDSKFDKRRPSDLNQRK
ncbi:hypothetical protein QVD17_15387 [Tagetes erecta]|uniref:Uncharacterized protein n=1 Tax=Tagetes erecta TaxID=13708 RepID=A0AAD8NYL1_TARER|nr:hypothetical protein QVD17_15387 [Tagetes erecta]